MRAVLNFVGVVVAMTTIISALSFAGEPGAADGPTLAKRTVATQEQTPEKPAPSPQAQAVAPLEPIPADQADQHVKRQAKTACSTCRRCCVKSGSADCWGPYYRDPFGLHRYNPSMISLVPTYVSEPNIHEWKPWLAR